MTTDISHLYWVYVAMFWYQRGAGVASVSRNQGLPLCQTVPVGSKMDPTLAKPEPIRKGSGTSVIMHLRKCKKMLCRSCERSEKKKKARALQTRRSVQKEGQEVL